MSARLWLPAHPVQFLAIQVVGPCYLRPCVVNALLALLQIVGVVAAVGIDGLVVDLQDQVAHLVEEVAVVRHHQQRLVTSTQIALQPFYHLEVEVVGRLVEDQEVGLQQQHVGQGHPLQLSTTQFAHLLLQVLDAQLRQHLLGPQHLLGIALVVEAGVEDGVRRIEMRRLLQIAHTDVVAIDDLSRVVALVAVEDGEQGRFARAVARHKPHLLSLRHRETHVVEKHLLSKTLREMLDVQI